jgi:hypothetical protein
VAAAAGSGGGEYGEYSNDVTLAEALSRHGTRAVEGETSKEIQ